MDVLVTCQYEEDPIKNRGARVFTIFSQLLPYGSYPLPWTSEIQSDLAQNLLQPFSNPIDGSDKISLRLVAEIFKFENVNTQTTARLVNYKLTFEPSAQVS